MPEIVAPLVPWPVLADVFIHFSLLSLLATGGAISLAPDMHRYMVGELKLITDAEFTSSIAIAQAAPGPNVLFVTVMGWQAAGVWGALATTIGVMVPSATLVVAVNRISQASANALWVRAMKEGLAPVAIGLMIATAWILCESWSGQYLLLGFVAICALAGAFTRLAPLSIIAAGALFGGLGIFG